MRNIKPITFCLLSTALSVFCFYEIVLALLSGNASHLHITQNIFLNFIIDTVNTFNNNLQLGYLIGIGLLALLFELLFSDSMHEFFSRLPLGSIKKYDYIDHAWNASKYHGFKYQCKHFLAVLAPALIIGFYVIIHLIFKSSYPDNLDLCVNRILPVAIVLTLIASIALVISVIKCGGLWGALVRLPLLFTSNICLCSVIGLLIVSLGVTLAFLLGFLIFSIVVIPITFRIMLRLL